MNILFGLPIILGFMSVLGLGIYTLLLAIKALKIYIKNNS